MSAEPCTCDPVPMTAGGEGPSETCPQHGRSYHEWVERGDILNARLEAVKEVIAKARRTPAKNDPYRVALDIADDLEAAVYLDSPEPQSIDDLRAAVEGSASSHRDRVTGRAATAYTPPEDVECCASGRCEVCSPGFLWRNS